MLEVLAQYTNRIIAGFSHQNSNVAISATYGFKSMVRSGISVSIVSMLFVVGGYCRWNNQAFEELNVRLAGDNISNFQVVCIARRTRNPLSSVDIWLMQRIIGFFAGKEGFDLDVVDDSLNESEDSNSLYCIRNRINSITANKSKLDAFFNYQNEDLSFRDTWNASFRRIIDEYSAFLDKHSSEFGCLQGKPGLIVFNEFFLGSELVPTSFARDVTSQLSLCDSTKILRLTSLHALMQMPVLRRIFNISTRM
jgi:hypothetical protein